MSQNKYHNDNSLAFLKCIHIHLHQHRPQEDMHYLTFKEIIPRKLASSLESLTIKNR